MGKHRKPRRIRRPLRRFVLGAAVTAVAVAATPAAIAAGAVPVVDWGPIIACESGGDPAATNPSSTASGLYQFLDSTWAGLGGTRYGARAKNATPAQQLEIANKAYAQSGFTPWAASQACWGAKTGGSGRVPTVKTPTVRTPTAAGDSAPGPVSAPANNRAAAIVVTDASPDSRAPIAVAFALAQTRSTRVWGGSDAQAFDGSGLTTAAYATAGITLAPVAGTQYDAGPHTRAGAPLAPGDLLYYGSPGAVHRSGIYIGNQLMVTALAPDHPAQVVAYRSPGDTYLGATRPAAQPRWSPLNRSARSVLPQPGPPQPTDPTDQPVEDQSTSGSLKAMVTTAAASPTLPAGPAVSAVPVTAGLTGASVPPSITVSAPQHEWTFTTDPQGPRRASPSPAPETPPTVRIEIPMALTPTAAPMAPAAAGRSAAPAMTVVPTTHWWPPLPALAASPPTATAPVPAPAPAPLPAPVPVAAPTAAMTSARRCVPAPGAAPCQVWPPRTGHEPA